MKSENEQHLAVLAMLKLHLSQLMGIILGRLGEALESDFLLIFHQ